MGQNSSFLDPLLSPTHQDDGTPLPRRANINFIGFTVADNATTDATDITNTGGGGSSIALADHAAFRALSPGSLTDKEVITFANPPGTFVYSASTGAGSLDDDTDILKLTAIGTGANGRAFNINATELNPLSFGALPFLSGAGVANLTAFSNCLAAAKANKKSVRVPQGDWYITCSGGLGLDLTNTGSQTFHVHGDGMYRTRLLFSQNGGADVVDDAIFANTCNKLILSDLSVVCTNTGRAVNLSGSGSDIGPLVVSNVEITGATAKPSTGSTAGLRIVNLNDPVVSYCEIHGNGYANGDGASGGAPTGDAQIDGYGNGVDLLIDTNVNTNKRIHLDHNRVTPLHTAQAIIGYDLVNSEIEYNKVFGNNTPGVRAKNRNKPIHTPGTQDDASGYGIAIYHTTLREGHNKINFNYVEETAGTGIYLQGNNYNEVHGNTVKHAARYQADNQLPVGAISANYGPNDYAGNILIEPGNDTGISDGLPQGNPPGACGYDIQGDNNGINGGLIVSPTKIGVRINGVFKNNTIGGGLRIVTPGTGIANLAGNKLTGLRVMHVVIDTPTNAGVAVDSADDCTLIGVDVTAPGAQGIAVGGDSGGSTRINVLGCHVKSATSDYAFMIRASNSRVEKCTAPSSTRGLLLGTGASGCDASGSTALDNDFRDATTDTINVTGTNIQTFGNRTPIGIENLPVSRGGIIYVRGASSANHTLTGALTENGITYATGDRYLAKDQGSPGQNGVYIVNTGVGVNWQRAPEFDSSEDLRSGALIRVGNEDTVNGGTTWCLTIAGPYTIGSTSLTFKSTTVEILNNVSTSVALIGDSLQNTSAASAGAQEWSPIREQVAHGWQTTGPASESVAGGTQVRSVQGTTHPSGQFHVMFNINAAGYISVAHFDSDGSLTVGPSGSNFATTGVIRLPNAQGIFARDNGNTSDIRILYLHTDDNVYIPGFYSKSDGSKFSWFAPTVSFDASVSVCVITHDDNTTNGATGAEVGLLGTKATGTTSHGGNAYLKPNVGTSTNGEGRIYDSQGTPMVRVADGAWSVNNVSPTATATVTGALVDLTSAGALKHLLTELANKGIIIDGSS